MKEIKNEPRTTIGVSGADGAAILWSHVENPLPPLKSKTLTARKAETYRGARRMAARRAAKELNATRGGAKLLRWPDVFRQYFKIEFKSARRS